MKTGLQFGDRLQRPAMSSQAGVLVLVLAPATAVAVAVGAATGGMGGALAALAAGTVCLVSGLGALAVGRVFHSPQTMVHGVLLGMMIRMALPLAVCLVVYVQGGVLADHGMAFFLLGIYPLMLLVETVLSVRSLSPAPGP